MVNFPMPGQQGDGMSFGEKIAPVIGRGMLASLFLLSGVHKIQNWDQTALMMSDHGISMVGPLLAAAIAVEIGAGFGLLIGFHARVMALMLFVFTMVVNFAIHDFWAMPGDAAGRAATEMQLFVKNVGVAGGLLMIVGLGAGVWSYDDLRDRA
jgi:putative oxidoreductase